MYLDKLCDDERCQSSKDYEKNIDICKPPRVTPDRSSMKMVAPTVATPVRRSRRIAGKRPEY